MLSRSQPKKLPRCGGSLLLTVGVARRGVAFSGLGRRSGCNPKRSYSVSSPPYPAHLSRAFWRCCLARRMVLRVDYLPNPAREPVADRVQILVRLGNSTMIPRSLVKSSRRPMHRSQTQSNGCCYGPSAMRTRVPYRPPLNIRQRRPRAG
jgi:hypothetical protein